MSASNVQKTPFTRTFGQGALQRAAEEIQRLGKSLPCSVLSRSGQIVTVKFELDTSPWTLPSVTVPIATSAYDWLPLQAGDTGVVAAMDAHLSSITGLPGGTPDMTPPANLSALVFIPVAKASWTSGTYDTNKRIVVGPSGVVIKDSAGNSIIEIDDEGNVVVHGLKSYSYDVNGYGTRITHTGGSNFTQDNYTLGASVTTVNHTWTPPSLPSP